MVTILFKTESHYPVDRKKIKQALQQELNEKIHSDAEVSITIVGNRQMHTLNKQYRHIDETTDVLSFPQHDPSQPTHVQFVSPPDDVLHLGDIVVSYPQAVEEAVADNTFVDDTIIELIRHGIDHLLGIHHA